MKPHEAAIIIILLAAIAGSAIGISLSVARIETSLTTGCAMGGK
jgi:uncharacterized integral membrane protein